MGRILRRPATDENPKVRGARPWSLVVPRSNWCHPCGLEIMNAIRRLRILTLIEGVSTLLLFFGAMPLKYLAGQPAAVTVVGWAHGLLFVLVLAALAIVMLQRRWPLRRGALVFVSALVPFGPFVIDRRMRGYEAEAAAK
jgi:integral membrane protein